MNPEITAAILSALGTLLVAVVAYFFRAVVAEEKHKEPRDGGLPNYQDKMKQLSAELARASSEVDKTLEEMETVSRMRAEALKSLEGRLNDLSESEKELQTRIDSLKSVSIPAVEYFLEMTEKGEKRSASRDYILFGAGVVVSTVITIILKLVFNI